MNEGGMEMPFQRQENKEVARHFESPLDTYQRDGRAACYLNLKFEIQETNRLYEEFIGMGQNDLKNLNLSRVVPDHIKEEFLNAVSKLNRNNDRAKYKHYVETDKGGKRGVDTRWYETTVMANYDKLGNVSEYLLTEMEITNTVENAFIDELTHVGSKGALESEIDNSKLLDLDNLMVVYVDINLLKQANDIYGHNAGDDLLRRGADILRFTFRDVGKVYRKGGDEFVVLLKKTEGLNDDEIKKRLDDKCQYLNKRNREQRKKDGKFFIDVDFAVGVSKYNKDDEGNIFEVIKRADQEMYKDKDQKHQKLFPVFIRKLEEYKKSADLTGEEEGKIDNAILLLYQRINK